MFEYYSLILLIELEEFINAFYCYFTMDNLKVLDLFSGVGGLSFGFENAGFKISGAVEFDPQIANSMKKNHKDTEVFVGDIREIMPREVFKKIGSVDVIVGGPPCQGFSLKGKRKGQHSIRINKQWRICFVWRSCHAFHVEIVDYH